MPEALRYRNDKSYVWNGNTVVPWYTDMRIDDYGFCSPELQVQPQEPINLYCNVNAHNSHWWPCDEMRKLVKAQPVTTLKNGNAYRDIVSNGKTFRFFSDPNSDFDNGIFSYHQYEYESPDGDCYMGRLEDVSSYEQYLPMTEEYVVCSVCEAPEEAEPFYDEEMDDEAEDRMNE